MKRIIPALTLFEGSTWITRTFERRLSSGDLINAVRFFSEMDADELCISVPHYESEISVLRLLESAIVTSTIPISIAANLKKSEEIDQLFGLGVDKVCLRVSEPHIPSFRWISQKYGSQSVCGVIYNHEFNAGINTPSLLSEALDCGIGELLAIDVQKEGSLAGLDLQRFQYLREMRLGVPLLIRGGISNSSEINKLLQLDWVSGVVASSLFMCTADGESVLPNYELEELHNSNL